MNDIVERCRAYHYRSDPQGTTGEHLTDLVETLHGAADRIEALETADRIRKELNAQMLMNATASGNRNYLAEIENLTNRVSRYKPYYEAVDKACILSNLGTAESFPSAEKAVNALCSWSQDAGAFFAEADRLGKENEELKCLTDTLQDELEANDIFPE